MEYYYEILAFHILSILSWMSMLFYLPRLFVYHIENKDTKEFTDIIKIQEYKLYKYIGIPAMWASVLSGSVLIYLRQDLLSQDWMGLKLITLLFMIIFSLSLDKYRKQLKNNICFKSSKFFRMYNEIPTLLSILIVVSVITKNINISFNLVVILILILMIFLLFKEGLKNKLKK